MEYVVLENNRELLVIKGKVYDKLDMELAIIMYLLEDISKINGFSTYVPTTFFTNKVFGELYRDIVQYFKGKEDNGQMNLLDLLYELQLEDSIIYAIEYRAKLAIRIDQNIVKVALRHVMYGNIVAS